MSTLMEYELVIQEFMEKYSPVKLTSNPIASAAKLQTLALER